MRVAVVGGGYAGLLAAYFLANNGCEVTLFEEHNEVGKPKHCTGLVSETVVSSLPFDVSECEESEYSEVLIYPPGGEPLELRAQRVLKLDRACLDKKLFGEVRPSVGARLGVRAGLVEVGSRLEIAEPRERFDFLVDARGVSGGFHRSRALKERSLTGLNVAVKCEGSRLPESVNVFFDATVARGFFAWALPIGRKRVVVGAGREGGIKPAELLAYFKSRGLLEGACEVDEVYGGAILRGPPAEEISGENWLAIGDSAGLVKPLTGGGIYPTTLAIPLWMSGSDCVRALNAMRLGVESVARLLRAQRSLSLLAHSSAFPALLAPVSALAKTILKRRLVVDYDRHERLPAALLRAVFAQASTHR